MEGSEQSYFRNEILLKLRMNVYETVLKPVLSYRSETWSLRKREECTVKRTTMRMVG